MARDREELAAKMREKQAAGTAPPPRPAPFGGMRLTTGDAADAKKNAEASTSGEKKK